MIASLAGSAFDLTGRVAVVTGGASGLGLAIASGFSKAAARVAICDVAAGALADAERILRHEEGLDVLGVRADVSEADQVKVMFRTVAEELGQPTILINAAGIPHHARAEGLDVAEWEKVLRINLTGSFLCAQAMARDLISAQIGGSIINISSIAGTRSLGRGICAFGVSKAGIDQLTRELAVEWARYQIRVNALVPCQIRTPALERVLADAGEGREALTRQFLSGIPLNRIGEPSDIVGPAIFLASQASALVTGVCLPVDGGHLALAAGGTYLW
jgi:NAD(P)-dependent dehydrogenase (short-subunit alcohol dehydrogenase family)